MLTKIADVVYEQLTGETEPQNNPFPVENMFADGCTCEELYNSVYAANLRLCDRLGTSEDTDVEIIINSLLRISRLLGRKMFLYGVKYQEEASKNACR